MSTHKMLSFLPKYSQMKPKPSSSEVENVKIGPGAKDLRAFKIERTNSDIRGTNILAGNQSGSTITSGGGTADASAFGRLSFGKKPKKAVFK